MSKHELRAWIANIVALLNVGAGDLPKLLFVALFTFALMELVGYFLFDREASQ